MNKVYFFFAIFLFAACTAKKEGGADSSQNIIEPKYAKGFWVENHDRYRDVFVKQTADSSSILHYRLVKKGEIISDEPGITTISVPLENIVCTSTTHIPLLDYLNETDKLIGFPSTEYVSSVKMRQRIEAGLVKELGQDNHLNMELVAALNPSMVMAYSIGANMGNLKKVTELGIPVVLNAEFLEQHPLGRAEWIKFMGLFLDKDQMADSVFTAIETWYLDLKNSIEPTTQKPTVLTGIPYGGIWYLPGGQNYAAQFFNDAGCEYLWSNDSSTGFLQLSLESVFEKATKADYWIGVGSFLTLKDLKAADNRFANISAFKNQNVFHYNGKIGSTGGNEYLELGYIRPDLVLKDIIQITHPSQYPNPELFFYKRLE